MSFDELKKAFSVMDINQNGAITHVELKELMLGFGAPITDEEAHAMISVGDSNDDGMLGGYCSVRACACAWKGLCVREGIIDSRRYP